LAPCSAPGIEGVAVQVVVSLNSSAVDSVLLPVDDPPATRTSPFATMELGSAIALAPTRAEVIVPAVDQLPGPLEGSNTIALAKMVDPLLPSPTRILPLVPGSVTAKCCSRAGLGMDASVLNALCTGSKR
jgi:hypothetical protein